MAATDDACQQCGALTPRIELTSKKVLFSDIGMNGQVRKTKTVAWLCNKCLAVDPDYNFPSNMSRLERMKIAASKRKASEQ